MKILKKALKKFIIFDTLQIQKNSIQLKKLIPFFILFSVLFYSCNTNKNSMLIAQSKLYAWCIVPFDSVNRTPMDRIEMLKQLNFSKYAYDYRDKHLSNMAEELALAKENGIDVIAVWMWIDDNWDAVDALNTPNEKVFDIIEKVGYKGQIWVSFNANYYTNLPDSLAIEKGAKMIAYLSKRANALGCKVGLYNHGDWFGEPANQIKIIEALPEEELGLVYNFHHAHQQIEYFPEIVSTMLPYLWYVNLNGLRKEGPKILPIGQGNHEKEMIKLLISEGYQGDFGILGHVENADVKTILATNLEGLKNL